MASFMLTALISIFLYIQTHLKPHQINLKMQQTAVVALTKQNKLLFFEHSVKKEKQTELVCTGQSFSVADVVFCSCFSKSVELSKFRVSLTAATALASAAVHFKASTRVHFQFFIRFCVLILMSI